MQRGGGGAGGASSAAAATAQAACAWHTAAQRVRPPSRACTAQCTACTAQRADPPAAHLQEGVFVQDAAAAGAQLAQPGLHVPHRLDGGRPRGRCHEALSPKGVGGCGGGGCWCCCRGRRGRGSSYGRRRGGGSHHGGGCRWCCWGGRSGGNRRRRRCCHRHRHSHRGGQGSWLGGGKGVGCCCGLRRGWRSAGAPQLRQKVHHAGWLRRPCRRCCCSWCRSSRALCWRRGRACLIGLSGRVTQVCTQRGKERAREQPAGQADERAETCNARCHPASQLPISGNQFFGGGILLGRPSAHLASWQPQQALADGTLCSSPSRSSRSAAPLAAPAAAFAVPGAEPGILTEAAPEPPAEARPPAPSSPALSAAAGCIQAGRSRASSASSPCRTSRRKGKTAAVAVAARSATGQQPVRCAAV